MRATVSPYQHFCRRDWTARRRSPLRRVTACGFAAPILFIVAGCAKPDTPARDAGVQRPAVAVDTALPVAPVADSEPTVAGPRLVSDSSTSEPVLEIRDREFVIRLPLAMARLLNDSLPAFAPDQRAGFDTAIVRWVDRPDSQEIAHSATTDDERLASALSVVVGDFDGDGRRDVAMQGTSGDSAAIVMLLAPPAGLAGPRLIYIARPGKHDPLEITEDYLTIVHPGDIKGYDTEEGDPPLHLHTDAIERVFFEKGSQLYYFDHGVVRVFVTSD